MPLHSLPRRRVAGLPAAFYSSPDAALTIAREMTLYADEGAPLASVAAAANLRRASAGECGDHGAIALDVLRGLE